MFDEVPKSDRSHEKTEKMLWVCGVMVCAGEIVMAKKLPLDDDADISQKRDQ